jgi:hypothetical protein
LRPLRVKFPYKSLIHWVWPTSARGEDLMGRHPYIQLNITNLITSAFFALDSFFKQCISRLLDRPWILLPM